MTEKMLRGSLIEAQKKGEEGLLIMKDWSQYLEHGSELQPGTDRYEFVLKNVRAGEDTTITFESITLIPTRAVAAPVEGLLSSDIFFNMVLDMCEEHGLGGPIFFLPSNELSKSC